MPKNTTKEVANQAVDLINSINRCIKEPSYFAKFFFDFDTYDYNKGYLDSGDHYIVYRAGRKVGKSTTTAIKILHFAMFGWAIDPEIIKHQCEIIIVAPTQAQAGVIFDTVKGFAHRSKDIERLIVRETALQMEIAWPVGGGVSKIYTRAAGERGDSLRGYIPNVIVLDEAAFIRLGIFKALLAGGVATNARVWMCSSPFGKSGYFFETCMGAKPTNPLGNWIEFRAKSTQNPTIAKNTVYLEELKKLTKDEYVQEMEGEFIEAGDALIPHDLIMNAVKDFHVPEDANLYLGVDVARTGRDETVYTLIAVKDGKVFVLNCEWEAQSNLVGVANKVAEYVKAYPRLQRVFMDQTGVGGGAYDICRNMGLPITGIFFTMKEKTSMYRRLRLLFENGNIYLRDVGKLVYQLGYLRKDQYADGTTKVYSDEHDDFCDSLAVACTAVDAGDAVTYLGDVVDRAMDNAYDGLDMSPRLDFNMGW